MMVYQGQQGGGRGPGGRGPGGPGGRGPGGPGGGHGQGGYQGGHGGPRRPGGQGGRFVKKDEFDEKVVDLRRVTRVVAGGKRFRFRATVVIGDRKGRVGVGVAKGLDVQSTVAKAKLDAKKEMLHLSLVEQRTIPHQVKAKYSAAEVIIKPSRDGQGLKAGGAVRVVLAMAGIKDASAKSLGRTPNKLTNALAAMAALRQLKPARTRGPAAPKQPEAAVKAAAQQATGAAVQSNGATKAPEEKASTE